MKKGFLFSIEAIMSVALVLTAIGLVAYSSYYWAPQDTFIKELTQADAAGMLYFNNSPISLDYNNTTCEKIVYYDTTTKSVKEKTTCRGYK